MRAFLEACVEEHQSAGNILHIRHAHIKWFNDNDKEHFRELLDVLQEYVLPWIFSDKSELNNDMMKHLGPGGIPVTVGAKNEAMKPGGGKRKQVSKKVELI
jgi:hypothetical protein